MVVYISGKITGDFNYKEKFDKAEQRLKDLGHIPLNPTNTIKGLTFEQYMTIDLAMVEAADAILMLPDWYESKGAKKELKHAKGLDKIIFVESGNEYIKYNSN
jgi:hypothetical protein